MCISCWIEEGSHKIINDNVKQAAELIKKIYEHPEGSVGALAHIVVDDWNLDDRNINYCLERCTQEKIISGTSEIIEFCENALKALKELKKEERHSALALYEKFFII